VAVNRSPLAMPSLGAAGSPCHKTCSIGNRVDFRFILQCCRSFPAPFDVSIAARAQLANGELPASDECPFPAVQRRRGPHSHQAHPGTAQQHAAEVWGGVADMVNDTSEISSGTLTTAACAIQGCLARHGSVLILRIFSWWSAVGNPSKQCSDAMCGGGTCVLRHCH